MIKKGTILFLFVLIFVNNTQAQQSVETAQYTMHMFNKYQFNPAYAGLDESLSLTGVYRQQWVDLAGKPENQNINMHMPVYFLHGGMGIQFENDKLGAEQNTTATISYNYHKQFRKNGILTFGIGGGLAQKSLDGTILRAPEGNYDPDVSVISHNDNFLPEGKESAIAPVLNAGIYFKNENYEVGLSASNLMESGFKFNYGESPNIKEKRNYFLNFALNWEISSSLTLQPSLLVKSDTKEIQTDFATILKYNDNIFGGLAFRGYSGNSIDAAAFLAGVKINEKLTLAYSYDLTLSAYNLVSKGSHEIMLNYNLNKDIGKGIPEKIIYSPRFL